MALPNVFSADVTNQIVERIHKLTPASQPAWGKMNVAQMLAHCGVTYEMVYEQEKHKKPGFFVRMLLKTFIKKIVVNEKPYTKNSKTAPAFVITDEKNFENEKNRLIEFIQKTDRYFSICLYSVQGHLGLVLF